MDAISDALVQIAGLSNTTATAPGATAPAAGEPSAYDISAFRQSFEKAQSVNSAAPSAEPVKPADSEGLRAVFSTLDSLNGRAETLESKSDVFTSGKRDMSPGDMLMLTVQSHEFLFHCELTANVANRTSDGIQQLFRQQG
ncbi:MAG: hypothetical protein AB8G17_05595 [Gammaproteobacteria bacterium]